MGSLRRNKLLSLALLLLLGVGARADEGGVSFWLPGQFSSFAAVPQQPGLHLPVNFYYYSGDASGSRSFSRGAALNVGLDAEAALVFFTPTWVPDEKWFGGQPSFSVTFGAGWNTVSADLSLSTVNIGTRTANRSDTDTGVTDLYPLAQIAWTRGVNNWMVYVMGGLPVGSYSSSRLANLGTGHAAIDLGGAYTYFNTESGLEASATLGFTYNWENSKTNYQNGVDSHLDWAVSQFLSENWQVGLVGYVYYQLTGDTGSGNSVGSFKSRVASVGPEIGYALTLGGQQLYFNLRGYWEFWAENRTEGYAVFATLSIPLGKSKK